MRNPPAAYTLNATQLWRIWLKLKQDQIPNETKKSYSLSSGIPTVAGDAKPTTVCNGPNLDASLKLRRSNWYNLYIYRLI